mgnify:CR=1 FL=1
MIELYWPEIIDLMYLKQLKTPVVRVINKKKKLDDQYYTFSDFKN